MTTPPMNTHPKNTRFGTRLASFFMILQAPLLLWRSRGRIWLALLTLASMVPLTLAIGWYEGHWETAFSIGIGAPLAVLLLPLWLFMFANLQIQNSPALAQLVPQLHHRVLQLVLLGWLLVAAGFALVASISLGHFWHLLGLFLLVLACYTWMLSNNWGAIGLIALLFALESQIIPPLQWLWQADAATTAATVLLCLIGGALTFVFLLRKGDPGHFQRYAESTHLQRLMVETRPSTWRRAKLLQALPWLRRVNPDHLRLYWQLVRPAASAAAGRPDRPNHPLRPFAALPPHFHAFGQVTSMLAALAAMWLLGAQPEINPWGFMASQFTAALLTGLALVMPITFVWRALAALHQSRREQQLLYLLPSMPDGVALNRQLLATLLGQFALVWLLALGCGVSASMQGVDNPLPALAPSFVLFALPHVLRLLRDHASSTAPDSNVLLWPVSITLALGLGWKWLQLEWQPIAPGWLLLLIGVPTLITGILRWQRLMRAAGAFPVGRLA